MSYKNDSYLVIANKFGTASSDAKAHLFETYDRLRDLTVSGPSLSGSGFGTAGNFLWQLASLMSPGAFMPMMGGTQSMSIPGTSYWSPVSGGTSQLDGGNSAFGIGGLGSYPGFPSGAAPVLWGFGSDGVMTGGASSISTASNVASMTGVNAAAYGVGMTSGFGYGANWVMPTAGVISGWGGIMQAMGPYLGGFGLPATVIGNLMQGTGGAAVAAYQNVTGRISSNADIILSNKVRNIETVVKMLDTQGDIVKKMLKENIDSDNKAIQNM